MIDSISRDHAQTDRPATHQNPTRSSKRHFMFALGAMIINATGWRRRLIAFAAGAVGALTQAPYNFLPAMVIPMTVAIWLIDGAAELNQKAAGPRASWRNWRSWRPWRPWLGLPPAARRAFAVGWWWGFGYFVAGLWWIGSAFLVEADEFAWALPLGVLGLPAALALYQGLGFMLARLIWTSGPLTHFCVRRSAELHRMVARTPSDGISDQCFRHGARRQSRHRATRVPRRPLWLDGRRDRFIRRACNPFDQAFVLARVEAYSHGSARLGGDFWFRRLALASSKRRRRPRHRPAHHAAQSGARR